MATLIWGGPRWWPPGETGNPAARHDQVKGLGGNSGSCRGGHGDCPVVAPAAQWAMILQAVSVRAAARAPGKRGNEQQDGAHGDRDVPADVMVPLPAGSVAGKEDEHGVDGLDRGDDTHH